MATAAATFYRDSSDGDLVRLDGDSQTAICTDQGMWRKHAYELTTAPLTPISRAVAQKMAGAGADLDAAAA